MTTFLFQAPSASSSAPLESRRRDEPWRHGEPALDDVMADPLVRLVMRRDGLSPALVWPVLGAAAQARGG